MTPLPSRRTFLRELAAGAALLPLALPGAASGAVAGATPAQRSVGRLAAGTGPLHLPGAAPADEAYWALVRGQFSFEEDRVPMNAANLCPSPRMVAERVTQLTHDIDVDCSFQNRGKFGALLEEARASVAAHLGVDADEIALVRNTSEANNTVNAGLPLEAGDEVVVWDQNHPTNNVAWDVRAARYGIRVRRVSVPARPRSAQELIDPFVAALTDRTRVLTFSHVSNVSGIRLPAREIAEAAHARGVYVHVDGAQSFGAHALDLRAMGCDSYAASTHKWMMGPKEAGVLYVKAEHVPRIWAAGVAPGWGSDAEPDMAGARKFESLGQRDDACLAAVGTAMELHRAIGPGRIEARVAELATALKEGVRERGVRLVTPMERSLSGGVVIMEVAGDARVVFDRLYREHGIAGAPTGGLRLSPHVYNTMEQVERAVAAVEAMRGEMVGG